MASRPGRDHRRARAARARVLAASNSCWLCGKAGATTIDHVIPVSRGGSEADEQNMRAAHESCNKQRGNRTDWRPPTPYTPSRPW